MADTTAEAPPLDDASASTPQPAGHHTRSEPQTEDHSVDDTNDNTPVAAVAPDELEFIERTSRKHLRMAARLAMEFGDDMKYVHGIGWHVWSKCYWKRDDRDIPSQAVLSVRTSAIADLSLISGDDRDALYSDIKMLETLSGLQGVVGMAKGLSTFSTSVEQLDPDPYALNTPGGVYNLQTRELEPHDRSVLHTKVTGASPTAYNPFGPFSKFIKQVQPDEEVRRFAQKICGYALLGKVRETIFPIAYGEGGTGKSTFLEVVRAAFGSYADLAPKTLLLSTGARDQHPTEIADLRGQRLVIVHETEQGQVLKTAAMKAMTGRDQLKGRFLYQSFFSFAPSHTFMLVTNHPPVLDADDDAAWERIKVIPFTQKFRGTATEDKDLDARIVAEDLSSVICWLIDGYHLYEEEGLIPPKAVVDATKAHNTKVDVFTQFMNDEIAEEEGATVTVSEITKAWNRWCKDRDLRPGRGNDMLDRLQKRGLDIVNRGRQQVVQNRRLNVGGLIPAVLPS